MVKLIDKLDDILAGSAFGSEFEMNMFRKNFVYKN